MLRIGIEALAPQPGTSKAAPGNKIYPYQLRKLPIIRADQVWALDTTYIPMAKGFVYLTAVVNVAISPRFRFDRLQPFITQPTELGRLNPSREPNSGDLATVPSHKAMSTRRACHAAGRTMPW